MAATGRSPVAATPDQFRSTLGLFATGVTVVATRYGDILHGMTANAFTSVSLDPLLVLVCVDRSAGMHEILSPSGVFAATILAADQEDLSVFFASSRRPAGDDQFAEVAWRPGPVTGCPLLDGGLAYVECAVSAVHAGGDHSIFVGEVVGLGTFDGDEDEPLIWYGGGYRRLAR